jgi:hypothetical protein
VVCVEEGLCHNLPSGIKRLILIIHEDTHQLYDSQSRMSLLTSIRHVYPQYESITHVIKLNSNIYHVGG